MANVEEMEYCSNCKRDIAKVNFVMHEVHCRRNIILCEKCNEPVPRSETEEHFNEYHAPVKCPQCSVSVEVSALDKHKGDECSKRPAQCQYCELQLPFCEIKDHTSYCGTRTEQCPSCGTFVMIKNQESHQGEECLAIQASAASAPRNNLSNSGATSGAVVREIGSDNYNSFAMDELSRMLNMARSGDRNDLGGTSSIASRPAANPRSMPTGTFYGSGASRVPKIKPKRNIFSSKSSNSEGSSRNRESNHAPSTSTHRRVVPRTTINNMQRNKRTNEQAETINRSTRRATTESHSNLSRENQTQDLDRLLAMHLAEDLNGDVDLNCYQGPTTRNFDSDTADIATDGVFNEGLELPCEFCGNALPVDQLYDHQNGCDLNPSNSNLNHDVIPGDPSRQSQTQTFQTHSNALNNSGRHHSTDSYQAPHMVDNLAYLTATDMLNNDPSRTEFSTGSDVMLPCEFCDNLFPEDVIIQHQAVCDANLTQTPRRMSPILTQGTRRRQMRRRSPGSHDAGTVGGGRRRQPDPFVSLGLGGRGNVSTGISRTEGRVASGRRPGVPKTPGEYTGGRTSKRNRNEQPRESYFARALAEDTSHLDNYEVECGGSRTERRRRSSAARTRETLHQFIQDPTSESGPNSVGLSKEQKARRNKSTRQIDDGTRRPIAGTSGYSDPVRRTSRGSSSDAKGGALSGYEPSTTVACAGTGSRQRRVPRANLGSDLEFDAGALRLTKPKKNTGRNKGQDL